MINIAFVILCVIRGFFIQIHSPYYDKSRILVHTAFEFENYRKAFI